MKSEHEIRSEKEGEEFAQAFSNFLNSFNSLRGKAAIKKMLKDHRSLQQATMRFFMDFVAGMAENSYDGRNEAAVELAKAIMELPERTRSLPRI